MGQENRGKPHLLEIRQCLLSENNVDIRVRDKPYWCGVFSSSNTFEDYSDVSDDYHIKISYRMGLKKPKPVTWCVYVHVYVHV